eukprot:jgi/Picre1/34512/NNA_001980.t1
MSNASADEEDFLELVVANETVCTWLDKWKSYAKDQNVESGPLAQGDRVRSIEYGGHTIYIKEGALGDGLEPRLESCAIMCQKMVDDPALCVEGKDVLEVGAGCGACGFLQERWGHIRLL